MAEQSRTQKSIRNARVALFFSVLTFALGFFSRKILLDALGADILGLYTTANNLCGFLNLAEMGITSAVAFSLYKPIFDNDRQAITEIVSIQGWLFRYVGIAMTVGAVILMSLFPVFFNEEKTNLPLWYSFATFGVIFLSQVLGYFFCYQQTLLSADQQEYKITYCFQGGRVLKLALQIVGIGFCGLGYKFWLAAELACGLLTIIGIWWAIREQYPWLKTDISQGGNLRSHHPEILAKVKQMMVHKVCFSVIDRATPVIVYGLISLSMVAVYGNYMMIVTNIGIFIRACFNSMNASLGNIVAEGDNPKAERYYKETTILRYWIVSIFCYCLYHLATPFMILWMGKEYTFDNLTLTCLVIYTFIELTCNTDPFINAYGLFQDVWASITKVILNIGLSILLGIYYGIPGILLGVTISLILIFHIWKPYFLYRYGFGVEASKYIRGIIMSIMLIIIAWLCCDLLNYEPDTLNALSFIYMATITLVKYTLASGILFLTISKEARNSLAALTSTYLKR